MTLYVDHIAAERRAIKLEAIARGAMFADPRRAEGALRRFLRLVFA